MRARAIAAVTAAALAAALAAATAPPAARADDGPTDGTELVDQVTTVTPRAALSAFLVKPAKAALAAGDRPRAIVLYQALALARGPASPEAQQLARLLIDAGQTDEAVRVLTRYAPACTDATDVAAAQALLQRLTAGPRVDVRPLALPSQVPLARTAFKLGRAAFARKQWGDALVYYHLGYALAPELPGFLRELGATYDRLGAAGPKQAFYQAYLLRMPFGKNADAVRAELAKTKDALATLSITSSLPCEEVWLNRQRLPVALPQTRLSVAPGSYKAMCLSRRYEIAIFDYATIAPGGSAAIRFDWAIVVNKLVSPLGRIAIENPNMPGVMLDLGVSSPEVGVVVGDVGRPLKMVLKDDGGTRVVERTVRITPGERVVVEW
ncbi:MAG TPA: tetratricopeptide repeat protein [Kofleriaceae bacterium]|nr:tetratricopeptide repeat protein [Kofleriaceae bacterium]